MNSFPLSSHTSILTSTSHSSTKQHTSTCALYPPSIPWWVGKIAERVVLGKGEGAMRACVQA